MTPWEGTTVKFHYHRRSRVYLNQVLRVFRPMGGGIGIVIWRHEFALLWR